MRIILDTKACNGCRACELACSFHHIGAFSPESSSIKVWMDNRTGRIVWSIDSSCDSCKGEDEPLCVKFCSHGGISLER